MEPRHSWQTCTSDDSGLEKEANTHTHTKKKKMKSGNEKQQCSESALLVNFHCEHLGQRRDDEEEKRERKREVDRV